MHRKYYVTTADFPEQHVRVPSVVESWDGFLAMAIQSLCLLKQTIIKDTSDIHVHVIFHGLQNIHVGANRCWN